MAMTVLDLKLVDASTGQIVFADRIAGNAQSEGLKGDFDRRKDPRYRFILTAILFKMETRVSKRL